MKAYQIVITGTSNIGINTFSNLVLFLHSPTIEEVNEFTKRCMNSKGLCVLEEVRKIEIKEYEIKE